jgi:uncharacterized Zn-finger protein
VKTKLPAEQHDTGASSDIDLAIDFARMKQTGVFQNDVASPTVTLTGELAKSFTCQICGKGVGHSRDLRAHLSSKHNIGKKFMCPHCGVEFSYKHNLKTHMLKQHGKST